MRAIRSRHSLSIVLLSFFACACYGQEQAGENPPKPLFRVKVDGKWGYIDQMGKVCIKPQFRLAEQFGNGFAVIADDDWSAYIDETGRIIAKGKGLYASGKFSEGLAPVWTDAGTGYIDQTGKMVIPQKFPWGGDFSDGLAPVTTVTHYMPFGEAEWLNDQREFEAKKPYAFMDRTGKIVFAGFNNSLGFKEGLASVKVGAKWGFIDRNGTVVIAPQFKEVAYFSEGLACVQLGDKWGFIDKTGKLVIGAQFDEAWDFTEGLAPVRLGVDKWGFIEKTGKTVIPMEFDHVECFSEGLAAFSRPPSEKIGFMDKSGKVVIAPAYDYSPYFSLFRHGLAEVRVGDKMGYIDKNGRYVWQPSN